MVSVTNLGCSALFYWKKVNKRMAGHTTNCGNRRFIELNQLSRKQFNKELDRVRERHAE